MADDRRLAELVVGGDDAAFEYLFDRYRKAVYGLFLQRTGSPDDASDLLQETFIKVYINIRRYSADYTFGQWLYTIARNTFVDFVRKSRDEVPLDGRFSIPVASSVPTPEERFINLQQRARLEGCMKRMSPGYRRLIEMRFFEELSYEEIAERLTMPMGTVKTRIHRARARLCTLILEGDAGR